jgi:hypothetical protein
MDDVIITVNSLESHNEFLRELFQRFRESKLKTEPLMCEVLRAEFQFLCHVATDVWLQMDPRKTEALRNIPEPKRVKQLKGFLGISSYYRC